MTAAEGDPYESFRTSSTISVVGLIWDDKRAVSTSFGGVFRRILQRVSAAGESLFLGTVRYDGKRVLGFSGMVDCG